MEKGIVLKILIKDAITLLLFYLFMGIWWGKESWFTDKSKEMAFFLGMGFFYFIMSLLSFIISPPLKLDIIQSNKHFNQPQTNFSIKGVKKTQEHERTIELKIKVLRKKSLWSKLMVKIIAKYNLILLLETTTSGLVLEADRENIRPDIIGTVKGFKVDLTSYLSAILSNSSSVSFTKGCEYVVIEDTLNIASDEITNVTPRILRMDGRKLPYFVLLLFKYNDSSCIHTINFKWE